MEIDKLSVSNLEIEVAGDQVKFLGDIDDEDPGEYLNPFFDKVLVQMGDNTVLDLRELDFLNSSGIKAFVSFILKKKPGVKITLKVDEMKSWQKSSLRILEELAPNDIKVTS